MTDHLFIIAVVITGGWFVWKVVGRAAGGSSETSGFVMPPDVLIKTRPLLTDTELHLYNLLRMAVQDHYLIFTRVPLWCLLEVEGERRSQREALRHLALKTADFALVHPGSRAIEQVVQVETSDGDDTRAEGKRREVQAALQAAGVRVTTLTSAGRYSVQQLAQLLGVEEPE